MRRIVVITAPDARHGFALAGVRQRVCEPEAAEALAAATLRDPEVGALLLDERLLPASAQRGLRERARRSAGLLILLPAPGAAATAEADYLLELIRRAIGYQVRLTP